MMIRCYVCNGILEMENFHRVNAKLICLHCWDEKFREIAHKLSEYKDFIEIERNNRKKKNAKMDYRRVFVAFCGNSKYKIDKLVRMSFHA